VKDNPRFYDRHIHSEPSSNDNKVMYMALGPILKWVSWESGHVE
jgi:hypothetical protein